MNNYVSRAELYEISDGLIKLYLDTKKQALQYIDIENFITDYLKLKIEYTCFAEADKSKMGFLADGQTPLLIYIDGKSNPVIFPKNTIVLDKFLLADKENGRRRFTMAHEAAHYILNRVQNNVSVARFHNEFDKERAYTKEEFAEMFGTAEWQADTMAGALLMPRGFVEKAVSKFYKSGVIKIYGGNTFAGDDKLIIRKIANHLKVSYTALVIRLRNLELLEYHDIFEFISKELKLGGNQ